MVTTAMTKGVLFAWISLAFNVAVAQSLVWRNDWTDLSPPTLARADQGPQSSQGPYALRFGANGDLLVSSLAWISYDSEIFRLGASGELRWSSHLGLSQGYEALAVYPASDGGAFVAAESQDAMTRLDGTGGIVWTRRVPAQWFAATSTQQIAVATCLMISSLSMETGSVDWQMRIPGTSSRCTMTGMFADDSDLYVSIRNDFYDASYGSRVLKVDSSGQSVWEYSVADDAARLIGIGDGRIYVATGTHLAALDAATGAPVWQAGPQPVTALLAKGNPAIPVIVAADAVFGISPTTGTVQWSRAMAVSDESAAVGDSVLVNTSAGLVKLDAATGAIAWTAPLPMNDSFGHPIDGYLAFGGLHQGTLLAVARVHAVNAQPPPFVQRIDFLSGQLAGDMPIASTLQGSTGVNLKAGDRLVTMRVVQDAHDSHYQLSSIDSSDGSEAWGRFEPPLEPGFIVPRFSDSIGLGVNDSLVAASIIEGGNSMGKPTIGTWTLNDGSPKWRVGLLTPGETWFSTLMSAPVVDDGSNVHVSFGTRVACNSPDLCGKTALYTFAAGDGSILWQRSHDVVTQIEPPYLPEPAFVMAGEDVVVEEGSTLLRLDGADGSIQWSADISQLESISWLHIADDGNILAVGFRRWGKFDASTGALLWSAPSPALTCVPIRCSVIRVMALSSGDVLQIGYKIQTGGLNPPMVALLHTDGSGAYDLWFPEADSPLRVSMLDVAQDAQDQVWLRVRESLSGAACSLRSLSRLDLATGEFKGRQVFGCLSNNPFASNELPSAWIDGPRDERLLTTLYSRQPPLPQTFGTALVDTTISAQGNLSVVASILPGPAMPGESIPFEVIGRYNGTAPLDRVRMEIVLPWGSAISALSCRTTGGTSCDLDMRDGDLHGEAAMQAGDVITIKGLVPVLDNAMENTALGAVIYGPTGLLEQDLTDNFASIAVAQSLFRDGFE